MKCTVSEYAARLSGMLRNDDDPFTPAQNPIDQWGEYLHEQEGGVISIAGRLSRAAGIAPPENIKGLMTKHNPLIEFLKGGEHPNVVQRGLFDFTSPSESVAKPILNEYIRARSDYLDYIENAPDSGIDVYREHVGTRATELLKKIKDDPSRYGVDTGNVYMTTHFLQHVENGWPYADFAGQEAEATKHLEGGPVQVLKSAAGNIIKSHTLLNPLIYIFHAGMTPLRVFSQYPLESVKMLPELFSNPHILIGGTIPEAERLNVYSKPLTDPNPKNWTREDWAKGLTGIPQTQTFNESLAYLLSKQGAPLDQTLERIALIHRDPLESPMFLSAPDRGGSISPLAYMRYAMYSHISYLNMVKRMADFKNPQEASKAAGSFLLYTGMMYALYGSKAAIPGSGLLSKVNKEADQALEDFDANSIGNQVYKNTGIDLSEAVSPLSFFELYYPLKMIENTGKGASNDIKTLQQDTTETAKGFATAHLLLLLSELGSVKGFTTPNSLVKAVKSYGKAVNDGSGNPLDVDWDDFFKNEIEANLGQRAANRFEEHHQQ